MKVKDKRQPVLVCTHMNLFYPFDNQPPFEITNVHLFSRYFATFRKDENTETSPGTPPDPLVQPEHGPWYSN
jgi:hypothetical protein